MNYIVIGCGRVGAQLAYSLFQNGHRVTVVDNNGASFTNLPADFLGRTIEGEATHLDVLKRAGIELTDGLAVVTNSDSLNAVIGQVSTNVFNLKNVVVRNYDPNWKSMVQAFKLNIVSSSLWGAQQIEDKLVNANIQMAATVANGELGIYEIKITGALTEQTLASLIPDQTCIVVGLIRDRILHRPDPIMELLEGDLLLVSATREGIYMIQQHLAKIQEDQS